MSRLLLAFICLNFLLKFCVAGVIPANQNIQNNKNSELNKIYQEYIEQLQEENKQFYNYSSSEKAKSQQIGIGLLNYCLFLMILQLNSIIFLIYRLFSQVA